MHALQHQFRGDGKYTAHTFFLTLEAQISLGRVFRWTPSGFKTAVCSEIVEFVSVSIVEIVAKDLGDLPCPDLYQNDFLLL